MVLVDEILANYTKIVYYICNRNKNKNNKKYYNYDGR